MQVGMLQRCCKALPLGFASLQVPRRGTHVQLAKVGAKERGKASRTGWRGPHFIPGEETRAKNRRQLIPDHVRINANCL